MTDSGLENKPSFYFFSKSVMLLSGLILLFFFFRVYLYYNLVFASISFDFYQTFQMFWWGLRFDLCVIGFLLLPVFLIFLLSLFVFQKWGQKYLFYLGYGYLIAVFAMTFMVYYFNLPFIIKNSAFGIPYWMRWQDYQSMYDLSIYPSYWHFDYVSEVQIYHVILVVIFSLLSSLVLVTPPNIKIKNSATSLFVYVLIMALMARGKLGQHHIRFEDSRFSKSNTLNELSLNPLWLIDKSKEQLSQDREPELKAQE